MTFGRRLRRLWRNLVHKDEVERELRDEVQSYTALLTDEKLAAGLDPAAARRAALVALGGVEQVEESARAVRLGTWLETVWLDLRFALRSLRRSPLFSLTAVAALALGIGATSAIFSVVNAVLLRPLPYARPERLAVLLHRGSGPVAPANFFDWRSQSTGFERMGAAEYWSPNLSAAAGADKIQALRVTSDVLALLGVPPALGRLFAADEKAIGAHEVVLSHGLWQRRFAGDPGALGQSVLLDGEPYTIIGVMPRGFEFPTFWAKGAELWAPLALAERATSREGRSLRVFARLKPHTAPAQARAEMAAITARLDQAYPGSNRDVRVRSLDDMTIGDVRRPLLVLSCGVGFVLLIACANVAHMLLARGANRRAEIALRVALGASRARLLRQLLTESIVLALGGGLAGIALAAAAVRALMAFGPAALPRVETVTLDLRVVAVTLVLSALTGIAFGLAPARQAVRRQPADALREGGRGPTSDARGAATRRFLVASEVALALVLLVGAGLMIRTFVALRAIDPGFDPRGVLTAVVSVTGSGASAPGRRLAFYEELLSRVRALPGVVSASAINHLPLDGDAWGLPFNVEGRPRPKPGETPIATYRVVLPGYFRTMGQRLVGGRDVAASDDLRAPGVVVVNQAFAERHWPGEDPLGKRLTLGDLDRDPAWLTVVGVAKNGVRSDWAAGAEEEVFLPLAQARSYLEDPRSQYGYVTLVVRGRTTGLAPAVRDVVASLERGVSVSAVQTMDDVVEGATAGTRFYLLLLVAFAVVALGLAAIGIYGVMGYAVVRRTNEIGLRVALGARPRDVLRLVLGEAAGLALAGTAAGVVGALLLTRLMASLLYGVPPTDAATFAATATLLAGVAALASYLPARRAMRIEPLTALRHE